MSTRNISLLTGAAAIVIAVVLLTGSGAKAASFDDFTSDLFMSSASPMVKHPGTECSVLPTVVAGSTSGRVRMR